MDVSPNASVPGAGALDDVYSGIGIRPICRAQGSTPGAIQGTVKDSSGSAVAGAIVTLETAASTGQRTAITDQAGIFPLFRRGARKLQDHDCRLWIRGLDRGERGGRFER